jgi:hypothetical protein
MKYNFPELYTLKQGDRQAWGFFWQACSDFRLGMPKEAYAFIKRGLFESSYGPGYMMEVGPKEWGRGSMPPYATAHGNLIAALTELFVMSSIWSNKASFFVNLPDEWKQRELTFKKIRTMNALVCSGTWSPDKVSLVLEGAGEYDIEIALPPKADINKLVLTVNGKEQKFVILSDKSVISFKLNIKDKTEILLSA